MRRTKGSNSDSKIVVFCELIDFPAYIPDIIDLTDLENLYIDKECMIFNQVYDVCESDGDGVLQRITIPTNKALIDYTVASPDACDDEEITLSVVCSSSHSCSAGVLCAELLLCAMNGDNFEFVIP